MDFHKKTQAMQDILDSIAANTFGRTVSESIDQKICVQCGQSVLNEDKTKHTFRDAMSVREYVVSGLCQKCQDPIFGLGEYAQKYPKDEEE